MSKTKQLQCIRHLLSYVLEKRYGYGHHFEHWSDPFGADEIQMLAALIGEIHDEDLGRQRGMNARSLSTEWIKNDPNLREVDAIMAEFEVDNG